MFLENDGQSPNFRGVRVHATTGYNSRRAESAAASRIGRMIELSPETPNVTIRDFCIAAGNRGVAHAPVVKWSSRGCGSAGGSQRRGGDGEGDGGTLNHTRPLLRIQSRFQQGPHNSTRGLIRVVEIQQGFQKGPFNSIGV
jgi:hypothetical protein